MTHPDHFKKLILIAKIFYMCNTMKLIPSLIEPNKLNNWIEFLFSIIGNQRADGDPLITLTDSADAIDQLDKSDYWTLKGICCKISIKLYQK